MARPCILLMPLVLVPLANAVTPKLKPVENNKFLKDYTRDRQPRANKYYTFDHPYPTVQDTEDYDKDYVKDENNDGGVWGAQMKYDELRGKVRSEESLMNKFKRQAEREKDDVNYAEKKMQQAEEKVKQLQGDVEEAEKAQDEAAKKVDDLQGKSSGDGTTDGGEIGKVVDEVDKEVKDLEDCKKKLAATKAKLRKAVEERRDMIEKEEQERKAILKKLTAGRAQAIKDETTEEKMLKVMEEKVEAKNSTLIQAQKTYAKEAADVKEMEADLQKAEAKLRAVRHKQVDQGGGVYHKVEERSPAVASRPSVLLLAALLPILSHSALALCV